MLAENLDLRETLSFQPGGGLIHFLGQRAIILDAVAFGLLRKELIENLGLLATRSALTRFGYADGWRAAATLKQEQPELWKEGKAGPKLHALTGQVTIWESIRSTGVDGAPLVDATWEDSYEAEQHLLHFGIADQPVCWTLVGWASGFVSFKEGREVYFAEDRCRGRGDACCHVVGRFKEEWGPELCPDTMSCKMESIDAVLQAVAMRLPHAKERTRERGLRLGEVSERDPSGIVACSESMLRALDRARLIAKTESSVVLTGESGVGKEEFARLIHKASRRSLGPFVAVNCNAITETLLESELFGHARGAFTGADREHVGMFGAANGGTLFLDEIGEISPRMQVRLLRALQEKEIRRVGESWSRPIDVRIIAATHHNLSEEVAQGRFRQDLYYRLHVIELHIPPVRQRKEDVLPLARFFLDRLARSEHKKITGFSSRAADRLVAYDWPGNVREIQNVVEYAVAMCTGARVDVDDLPDELKGGQQAAGRIRPLEEMEREHILAALRAAGGNKGQAAADLQIGIATLYRKLRAYKTRDE
jgi:DNA-binding NtrC family response regulator